MPCLTYFDIAGRAEATRLAFAIGGIDFEDKRISFPEFPTVAPTTPFKQLPVLEIGGALYGQSTALLRYAGKLSGLYPEDPLASLKVDEIVMAGEDAIIMLFGTLTLPQDTAKQARADLASGKLKDLLERIVAKFQANPSSPFFVGDSITIADLQIYGVLAIIESGMVDGIPKDLVDKVAPALKENHSAVLKHPKVVAYYASKTT